MLRFLEAEHRGDAGIVYCMSRRKVDALAAWLTQRGWPALPYHAGLCKNVRQRNQQRFLTDEGVVMVATIAFGMGIDKPNVRFVAHLDLPKSLEAYYQETGRAGRDGLPADAWMTYGLQDVILLRRMLEESTADDAHKRIERRKLDAMLGFCEVATCRRQLLLGYFGDRLDGPCGNCDTCLEPVDTWDATEPVQKALSCAYRTGQRFGVNYLIDVLRGKDDDRIRRFGHDRQSTFGIGAGLEANQWRSVFRQIVAGGLLTVDVEGHGSLLLTPDASPVLRGERRIELRRDTRVRPAAVSSKTAATIDVDRGSPLWSALRTLRKELADRQGVPPYVIFHDSTLAQMMQLRPSSREEFSTLSGVGERKLELYAEPFLALLFQHAGSDPNADPADPAQPPALESSGPDMAT